MMTKESVDAIVDVARAVKKNQTRSYVQAASILADFVIEHASQMLETKLNLDFVSNAYDDLSPNTTAEMILVTAPHRQR